jgi:DNA primase
MLNNKLSFLEEILGKSYYSSSTKEALFKCPYCNHYKKKLSINLETDRYQCWVCSKGGYSLYSLLKEFSVSQNVKEYKEKYKSKNVIEKFKIEESDFKLSLPEGYFPLSLSKDCVLGKKAFNYLLKRGITEKQILYYKIGISLGNEYFGRIIFPSFDKKGNLNYYVARDIDKGGYLAPKVPKGYRNQIIINELNINWNKPVVIVEGFVDAIKSGILNVVPLSGSILSKYSLLFQLIVKNNSEVILALDADAEEKANKIANNFLKYNIKVKFLNVKPFNDVGEMNSKDFSKRYNDAINLSGDFLLRRKFQTI